MPEFFSLVLPAPPLYAVVKLLFVITFRVSRRRREVYCGHVHLCVSVSLCVSVCLSAAACSHYCMDPDVTWGIGRGCPLVVHYWADLQSVHGLRCYGNIRQTRNVSEYMPVLALCLVFTAQAMLARSWESLFCSSVCLSVVTRVLCD